MDAVTGPPTPAEVVLSGWQTPEYRPRSPPNHAAQLGTAFLPWAVQQDAALAPPIAERPWLAERFTASPQPMDEQEFERLAAGLGVVRRRSE